MPKPRPGEVLVQVAYCGVCGSDIPRVLQGTAHAYPIILGHEFSGKVIEAGSEDSAHLVGKRVAGIPLVPCCDCADCAAGNYSLCRNYSFIGSRRPGAFAEYIAVPARNVMPLPDAIPYRKAAFMEPATVAQHAIDIAGFSKGSSVAIMGCGTIGIITGQILQHLGASKVIALGRHDDRLRVAQDAGLKNTFNTSSDGWRESLLAEDAPAGFDFVFDASGNAQAMVSSIQLAANKGHVCMIGTPKTPMQLSVREWETINRRELTLTGSWMSYSAPFPGSEWNVVADLMSCGAIDVTPSMIDTLYPLESIAEGFARFEEGSANRVTGKLLISVCGEIER